VIDTKIPLFYQQKIRIITNYWDNYKANKRPFV